MSTPSLLNIPYRVKGGVSSGLLYSQIPETGAGDFTVTRATTPTAGQSTRINSQGFIELVPDHVARLDYPLGGAVNGCPALLVEPAATNSIRNNSMVGAVAGSPGTLPTNWAESLNGLVRQSVALGTENGVSYIDIRYSGTATGGSCAVLFETATQIVASTGQTWSNSVYLKIIAQPNPPIAYRLGMWEYNTSGTVFGGAFTTAVVPTTTSLQRFTQTRALTGATTDRVRPLFDVSMTSGQTYDFTIRIGYPQMELGSVATSVIPTTTQAITRAADTIVNTTATALIGQSEGTIYWDIAAVGGVITGFGNPQFGVRNSAFTNWIGLTTNVSPNVFRITANATTGNLINYQSSITSGKAALAWSSAGLALYVNGSLVATSATNPNFSFSRVDIIGNMTFKANAFALYPTRIPNTAGAGVLSLATLTAP